MSREESEDERNQRAGGWKMLSDLMRGVLRGPGRTGRQGQTEEWHGFVSKAVVGDTEV